MASSVSTTHSDVNLASLRFSQCTDILRLVFENLPFHPLPEFQDFQQLRLVCKLWKEVADPLAFKCIGFLRSSTARIKAFDEQCAPRYGHLVEELVLGRHPQFTLWQIAQRYLRKMHVTDAAFAEMDTEIQRLLEFGEEDPRRIQETSVLTKCSRLQKLAYELKDPMLNKDDAACCWPKVDTRPFLALGRTLVEFRLTSEALDCSAAILESLTGLASPLVKLTYEHLPGLDKLHYKDGRAETPRLLRAIVSFPKLRQLSLISPPFFHREVDLSSFQDCIRCIHLERFEMYSSVTRYDRGQQPVQSPEPEPSSALQFAALFGQTIRHLVLHWTSGTWPRPVRTPRLPDGVFQLRPTLELENTDPKSYQWHGFIQPRVLVIKNLSSEPHIRNIVAAISKAGTSDPDRISVFTGLEEFCLPEQVWLNFLGEIGYEKTLAIVSRIADACEKADIKFQNTFKPLLVQHPEVMSGSREETWKAVRSIETERVTRLYRQAFFDADVE